MCKLSIERVYLLASMGLVQKDGVRGMIISYIGMVLGYVNKAVLFIIILSIEEIGLISLLASLGLLFAQFANLGTASAVWRFFPFFRNDEKRHNGILPLALGVVGIGVVLFTLLTVVFRGAIEAKYGAKSELFLEYYFWFVPIGCGLAFFLVMEVYLRALYKTVVSVFAMDILLRSFVTVLLFLLWADYISFHNFVIWHSFAYLIPGIILIIYLYRLGQLNLSFRSVKVSKKFRRILISFSIYNYINYLGSTVVTTLDMLMIAQMNGLGPTGVYATTVFLTSLLQVPYRSILRVSSPLVADHWKNRNLVEMKELYRKVSSVSLLTGLGAFLIIWLNIDLLFSFLKPEFQSGVWVFFFLMMGRIADMYCGLNGAIFATSKKYKYDLIFTLFLIFAVFFLNLLFIPWWGIAGAAISTAIALIVYNIGRLLFVWNIFKIHPFDFKQLIIIGLGGTTVFLGWLLGDVSPNRWLQMMVDLGIFTIIFVAPVYLFSLEPETISYIQKSWNYLKKRIRRKG